MPTGFQFNCNKHLYGWNIKEDGTNEGCPHCKDEFENPKMFKFNATLEARTNYSDDEALEILKLFLLTSPFTVKYVMNLIDTKAEAKNDIGSEEI